jgi:hypothetical protein
MVRQNIMTERYDMGELFHFTAARKQMENQKGPGKHSPVIHFFQLGPHSTVPSLPISELNI